MRRGASKLDAALRYAAITESLEDLNSDFSEEITKIEERAETFRQQLIEKFSAMEAALALADSMLQQVRATTEAMFADS